MSRTPSTELRALWGLKGGFKVIRTSGAIEAFEPEPHQQKLRGFNAVRKHHQFFFMDDLIYCMFMNIYTI